MIETIEFKDKIYPALQSKGFAAKFAFPFAFELLEGIGFDIGYSREVWKYPDAIGIEPTINPQFDAMNLPAMTVDYIFSSHCLEHIPDWVGVLDYWQTKIREGGILFLYLPSPEQEYWKPWNNRKHVNNLSPKLLKEYLTDRGWKKIFVTEGYDLNHSFYAVAEK